MKLWRPWTLAVLAALALCPAALAAPATVDLRVEGSGQTVFEGPMTTDGHDVTTASGGTHHCDGTNGGANPTPGPTMTGALDDGARSAGFGFDGTYDSGFDDFFITRIGGDENTGAPTYAPYWGLFLNWVATNLGGCQQRVQAGDQVQFLYSSFGQPLLELQGAPATAAVGQAFQVTVLQHDGSGGTTAAGGAEVAGRLSGSDGSVTLSFDSPGTRRLKATRQDAVRSNAEEVCIYEPGSGQCGTVAVDRTAPDVSVRSPRDGARYGRGPRRLAGRAEDGGGLHGVYFRLRRIARGGCRWYSQRSEAFTHRRGCAHARFVRLGTDGDWSYLLPERLPHGRYILDAKALDRSFNAGRARARFSVR